MPSVTPRTNPKSKFVEPFDKMLRRFKKSCEKAGIVEEVRKREFFEKPAAKKHKKMQDQNRKRQLEKERQALNGYRRKR